MADVTGSGYMGDATSGIGQGLAFVLPEGKAATYAMQLAQTHSSQLQMLARAKVQAQQKLQAQYESDFKDQTLPKAFAPFDKQLNDRHNKWLQDAAKSYATTGKNPFNDPSFVSRHNDEVLVPARKSQELGTNYTKLRAIAETDPTNKYTKESKQKIIDYQKQIESDPFSTLDKPLPQLVETPATVDELVKTLKPDVDGSHNKAQAFSALTGDPKWHDILKGYGYNPDLPDFGVYSDPKSTNGKRVWYTNPTFTGHQADLILEAPEDIKNKKILDDLGIHPGDQYAREKLQHAISDQNAAMGKAISDIGNRMDSMVPDEKRQQLTDQQFNIQARKHELRNSDIRLGMEQERLNMEKNKQHADNLVQHIYDSPGSLEGLNAISKAYEVNGAYGSGLKNLKDDGQTVSFTIPSRKKLNPNYTPGLNSKYNPKYLETQPEKQVVLDRNDPISFKAGIYEALKNVGSPTQISKFVEGKGIQDKTKPTKSESTIKGTGKSIWDN